MAAQATVRVQWNGERGPRLSNGLGIPEGHRSHTRHRLRHCTRNGAIQVTRGRLIAPLGFLAVERTTWLYMRESDTQSGSVPAFRNWLIENAALG